MSAWLLDIEGNWHEANGDIEIRTIDFITRLQTIKGEQSFNANNGLDFLNIINGSSLLEVEVENIVRDFNNYFDKCKIVKIEEIKTGFLYNLINNILRLIAPLC